ncbi:hypothetical protein V8Z74_02405 [Comamonas sp. w2-DMI]|uniref:hypothetical protein n=1 Tax=Comamonas sp. w2-DMI TaxID=3126391 RepID=UPI0032E4E716
MKILLILIAIAVLALCALGWLLSHMQDVRNARAQPDGQEPSDKVPGKPGAAPRPAAREPAAEQAQPAPAESRDVHFRMQGERGMGGPVYGDVMCADGVYLPMVWESDMHTSFDGRWLRTGFYESDTAHLVDRKSRRSWLLSRAQAQALEGIHWRLPRWSGETINESGLADDEHVVMSDASFEAWLGEHVASPAQPLVAVRDLWMPLETVPPQVAASSPALTPPPAARAEGGGKPAAPASAASPPAAPAPAAPKLTLERHWPATLRHLRYPLEPLERPNWQLMIDGKAQPWLVDEKAHLAWREDGQAFALYACPAGDEQERPLLRLAVWSVERGWQQWPETLPADRKSWSVGLYLPEQGQEEGKEAAKPLSVLRWEGAVVAQRVELDTPETERLHDGVSLSCVASDTEGCAGHARDGQVRLAAVPRTTFTWLRDPRQPEQWRACSEPVAGQRLIWTLRKNALDEQGETAAYSLQWGERHLAGNWALEHVVVQGRRAVLMPHGKAPERGGNGAVQIWDGQRLQNVDLPWPVVRLIPVPGRNGGAAVRVGLVALTGCLADKDRDANTASWRWPVHSVSTSHLARPDWSPLYAIRHIAPDAQGRWRLLPRWREVRQIQHPCADGDYVWRDPARGDALWWWGGVHARVNNYWEPETPRFDGVCVTRSGTVLCGTGPSACPHPAGEGWVTLEWLSSSYSGPGEWKLHWINPVEKEVRSLGLQAWMPLLLGWDAQGLHWREAERPAQEGEVPQAPERQLIVAQMWNRAGVEKLRQGPQGLWLRKQDLSYAEALLVQDDWPWERI